MMLSTFKFAGLICSISLALTACNLPSSVPQNGQSIATSAAQTVEAALSPAASPIASATQPAAAETSTPTASSCDEQTKINSWTRDGVTYDAKETEKNLAPNKGFVMSWQVQNMGACVWDSDYKLVFESGTPLSTLDHLPVMPVGYLVHSGEVLTITVQMTAPSTPGKYDSTYSLVNHEGKDILTFGVITNVGSASTSTSLAAPGNLRYTYDCTSGNVTIGLIWVDKSTDEDGYRIYRDGNKLADIAAGSTSYQDIAPSVGKFKYTVAAFNVSGESPATVNVETSNCK